MASPTVQVVVDLYDGSSAPACAVTAEFTPSSPAGDTPDAPVRVTLSKPGGYTSVALVPTDAAGARTAGWAYYAEFSGVPGLASPFWFQVPAGPAAFTCTSASPGVFTWTPAGQLTSLPNGTGVQLSGSAPAGLLGGFTYFVTGASGNTFSVAASPGGPALPTTSTGSGNLTVTRYNLSALTAAPQPGSASLLALGASTGLAGFALTNGTPVIASWTAPNDGKMHRVLAVLNYDCTSTCTGGSLGVSTTTANGTVRTFGGFAQGNYATGWAAITTAVQVAPGSVTSLVQASALTAGAVTFWADLIAL